MRNYDVIVVGSGVAGLYASLKLNKSLKILLITKEKLTDCNSYLAQGGVSVLKDDDDFEIFLEDTLKAGKYKNNVEAVKIMINKSRKIIDDLILFGVEFENEDGLIKYTKEGAHSNFRIVYHKDITGKEIVTKLIDRVTERGNIEILENTTMVNILNENSSCSGITVRQGGELKNIYSKKVIIATGGFGGLFKNSTNYPHIKGDGIAIAINNGLETKDISYIQIHPTSLYNPNEERRFLISESLRGEGAYLLNNKNERFVDELLPRDVVSNAIFNELEKSGEDHVYLSFNHKGKEFVKNRYPNIYAKCKEIGFTLGEEAIPVTPAQHYFMGGIKVDKKSSTKIQNLYAVGETSCLGVHGQNRLASNSLLEALVFSGIAADDINKNIENELTEYNELPKEDKLDYTKLKEKIKRENEDFYEKWIG